MSLGSKIAVVICAPFLGLLYGLLTPSVCVAKDRFSEIVLDFSSKRNVKYYPDYKQNALILEISKTAPKEIEKLYDYDERLVKRVLIKDLGPQGVVVTIVLRDRNLRATVDLLQEPFRIALNFFDQDYKPQYDPISGLPLANLGRKSFQGEPLSDLTLPQGPRRPQRGSSGGIIYSNKPNNLIVERKSDRKYKLLQPTPQKIDNSYQLNTVIKKVSEGRGPFWDEYPFYIYPIQTAPYTKNREKMDPLWQKRASREAVKNSLAMAGYAFKLFSFGHESRALIAYQQVLHNNSNVFKKDALHLWALSEIHFGQGNLTLANGYYQTLTKQFKESPLAKFAKIRMYDIKAILLLREKEYAYLPDLAQRLAKIDAKGNGEVIAQINIRRAFWYDTEKSGEPNKLPPINENIKENLKETYDRLEGPKTSFLAASLMLWDMLKPKEPWDKLTGEFGGRYLERYKNTDGLYNEYIVQLKTTLIKKLSATLIELASKSNFVKAVDFYEALPKNLKMVAENPKVAWALGESYRNLSQPHNALEFYRTASEKSLKGPDRFKATYWISVLATKYAAEKDDGSDISYRDELAKESRQSDMKAFEQWGRLNPKEKHEIRVAYKNFFESDINEPTKLQTSPKIVLESWEGALSTKQDIESGEQTGDWKKLFSPKKSTVILFRDLAKKFQELGLNDLRRKSILLLKKVNPEDLKGDKEAAQLWANQLLSVAEEYRKSNQYLEAGELYSFTAQKSPNWAKRAEALYKGGLLLYRAGQRQKAIESFTAASQDGNNLFYANLAKERLIQLKE